MYPDTDTETRTQTDAQRARSSSSGDAGGCLLAGGLFLAIALGMLFLVLYVGSCAISCGMGH